MTNSKTHPPNDCSQPIPQLNLIFLKKNKQKILKVFLLNRLYQIFCEILQDKIKPNPSLSSMEYHVMDNKIIQFLIQEIVETGKYTYEGIAFHTRIPFDIIYEAACGIKNQFSITFWSRIADLYLQLKPDVMQRLMEFCHE